MPYHPLEMVGVVQELARQIAGMRADLRRFGIGLASDADSELIEAIHAALGDQTFLAAELLGRSLRLDAPGAHLATLVTGKSVRAVGKALARAANTRTVSGLVLRQVGESGAGLFWHVAGFETRKPID